MTTTTVLGRVPIEEINRQARQVRFGRLMLTVLAGILFGIGWLVAKAFALLWLAMAWSWTAIRLGWQEARKPSASGP